MKQLKKKKKNWTNWNIQIEAVDWIKKKKKKIFKFSKIPNFTYSEIWTSKKPEILIIKKKY